MRKVRVVCWLLVFLLVVSICNSFLLAGKGKEDVSGLIKAKNYILSKINKVKSALKKTKKQQRELWATLRQTQMKLEVTENKLRRTNQKLEQVESELYHANYELKEAEARLNEHMQKLSLRLRDIYECGDIDFLEVVLGVAEFGDFVSRGYFLENVMGYDVELLRKIEVEKEAVAHWRDRMMVKRVEVSRLHNQQVVERKVIKGEYSRKAQILGKVSRERAEYERALAELERNSREIEQMLKRLMATPAGRRRLAQPWRGKFIRPVDGELSSGFGYRTHPIFKIRMFHTGVDIAAPEGRAIVASGDGLVVFSGWWGGYGKAVIIDHGGGISTVYAHCSQLLVREGQGVRQGQVIARVGDTGIATGSHVHFEVRKNGVPINPLGR